MPYTKLDDRRKICLECLDSAVMDTDQCQPLYFQIKEFFEGLNMEVEQEIPLRLVERQVINDDGEKDGPETRGACYFEHGQIVSSILIAYGLPRLLTGEILAHEMMHAWMWIQGYQTESEYIEEGICQVMAYKWLDTQLSYGSLSEYDRNLVECYKHQIETHTSPTYGDGYRAAQLAVNKYGLRKTIEQIQITGTFPSIDTDDEHSADTDDESSDDESSDTDNEANSDTDEVNS